jgi:hypothetical protein
MQIFSQGALNTVSWLLFRKICTHLKPLRNRLSIRPQQSSAFSLTYSSRLPLILPEFLGRCCRALCTIMALHIILIALYIDAECPSHQAGKVIHHPARFRSYRGWVKLISQAVCYNEALHQHVPGLNATISHDRRHCLTYRKIEGQ